VIFLGTGFLRKNFQNSNFWSGLLYKISQNHQNQRQKSFSAARGLKQENVTLTGTGVVTVQHRWASLTQKLTALKFNR